MQLSHSQSNGLRSAHPGGARPVFQVLLTATLFSALAAGTLVGGRPAQSQSATVPILVDAAANRHPINPEIYGVNYATTAQLQELNAPLNRNGGNNTTRYNWQLNADNRGNDWYYQSVPENSPLPGGRGDAFIADAHAAAAQPMLTIPTIEWVAKLGPNRGKLASFSIAKYGAQTDRDWAWFPDAGNGISAATGQPITGNDPHDANVPSSAAFQQGWVQQLVAKWGTANQGGLKYYVLDNEPSLWHATHRDVRPVSPKMEEIRDKTLEYGRMIKAQDPSAQVVGPEEWGWAGYLYSGYDQQWGATHGWSNLPDRAAHGGMDYLPWLLDQLRRDEQATGQRVLDVFTVHYYPQGGEFSNDTSTAMQLRRNRSTRSLWDPNYVDESWIGTQVQLVPRLQSWVNTYYPGTRMGITEYNWGAEGHINGATTQADIYGIFGREGLDLATRWTTPETGSPTFQAMKLYRNYDGNKSTFGDQSVAATVPNPDNLSAFAAVRTSDQALTVMVINKAGAATPIAVSLANYSVTSPTSQLWQLAAGTGIRRLADVAVSGGAVQTTVPAQSISLFVIGGTSAPPPSPVFTATATATPASVPTGDATTITTTVQNTGGAATGAIVDVEVYNSAGAKVAQQVYEAQDFIAGQSRTYTYAWAAPATAGTYTVKLGVFSGDWSKSYTWNDQAATITVTVPAPAAPTNLQATPGNGQVALTWAASAGAISYSVKRSTTSGSGYVSVASSLAGTAYTDAGLTNGATYYYVVTAANSAGSSANSAQVAATPASTTLAAPTNLKATVGSYVYLTWTGVPGAASYTVKRSTTSGSGYVAIGSGITGTNHFDFAISSGTTYYYVVTAVNAAGESTPSAQVSTGPDTSTPTAPAAPTNLQAAAGNGQVALTWTASTGAASYTVKRSTTSGSGYTPVTSGLTGTSYTDTSVANGTTYYYVVTAVNSMGESAGSSQIAATPASTGSTLAAPTNLKATVGSYVYLTWTGVSGASTYTVKRSTTSGSGYVAIGSGITGTNHFDFGVNSGTTYYYVVTAVNAAGESAPSAPASTGGGTSTPTVPVAPTGVQAAPGSAQITLTWTASSGATGYHVKRSTTSGSGYVAVTSGLIAGTSYTDTNVTNGTTYYYVVTAANDAGESAGSSQVAATPASTGSTLPAPANLKATVGSYVYLTWNAVPGASTYTVKRSTTSGTGFTPIATGLTGPTHFDFGVNSGTTYYYVVTAVNAAGESAPSAQVSTAP